MGREKLLAFAVTEPNESNGGIVFAKSNIHARKIGASEWNDGDLGGMSCRRASWADQYRDSGVPVSDMVGHGWHFECCGCGIRIDEDISDWRDRVRNGDTFAEMLQTARRYRKWTPDRIVGVQDGLVFCDGQCSNDYAERESERKRRQDRWLARFRKIILRRFPDAQFVENDTYRARPHCYVAQTKGRWRVEQVFMPFNFPGAQYGPASLDYNPRSYSRGKEKPAYTCAGGDVEAFKAYCKQTRPQVPA